MDTKRTRSGRDNAVGFTLVELMVVISIIAILATIVGYNVLGSIDEGNVTAAQAQIRSFKTALVAYKLKFKRFPDSLDELVNNAKGINFLESDRIPNDPWNNPYVYRNDGSSFTIVSYGADSAQGGSGYNADISSDNLAGDQT